MLLDNAIIVIENNSRYREMGLQNRIAVIKGTNEVSMPIIASTLTTVAVFLPLIFVRGIAGELFRDQSYAIAFSLLSSIITSLTIVPMLDSIENFRVIKNYDKYRNMNCFIKNSTECDSKFYRFLFPLILITKYMQFFAISMYIKVSEFISKRVDLFFIYTEKFLNYTIDKYERLLIWSLKNKKAVILIIISLMIISTIILLNMKKEFIPSSDKDEFVIEIENPKGTSLKGNAEIISKIEKNILSIPNVIAVVSNIGRVNDFDFINKEMTSVNKTNIIVKLDTYEHYKVVQEKIRLMLQNIHGIKYSFNEIKTSYSMVINPSENDIVIKIKNSDIDKAYAKAELILNKIKLSKIDGLKDIKIAFYKSNPELL